MSSVEGSETSNCSSQTRKFGLYKTIDERTEEFLKLSKKRQIRQGCACAVVTTVITVSVAIVIFFLCKYALESSNTISSKKISDTRYMTTDESLVNDNFNVSAALVQLGPLLRKILEKKAYLDKFVDKIATPPTAGRKMQRTFKIKTKLLKMMTTSSLKNTINTSDSSLFNYRKPWRETEYQTKLKHIRPYDEFEKKTNNLKNETILPYQKSQNTPSFIPKQKMRHSKVLDYINGITTTESDITTQSFTTKTMETSCDSRKKSMNVLSKLLTTLKFLIPHVLKNLQICKNGETQPPFLGISFPITVESSTVATTTALTTKKIFSQVTNKYISKISMSQTPAKYDESTESENHKAQRLISKKLRTKKKSNSQHPSILSLPKAYSPYKQRKTKKQTKKHRSFVNLEELWSKFKNTADSKIQPDKNMLKMKHMDSILRGVKDVISKKIQIEPPSDTTKIYDLSNKLFNELENAIFNYIPTQQVHAPKKQKILSLSEKVERYKKLGIGDDQRLNPVKPKHTPMTQNSPTFLDIMLTIANEDDKPQHKN